MDPLFLSRVQFAVTTSYHFLFVPLTIGIGLLVAIMETLALTRRDVLYERMARFWGKFFLVSVAMGVVTGIVLEFQFGLNWARFSRYVGDVFGPPLAIESWFAFFMESVFVGVWLYGRNKLSPKLHVMSIWLVTLGAMLSAFWIITANGFMQEPVGYVVRHGRVELVDFFAVVLNPTAQLMFWHAVFSCLVTSAFFVIAVSSWFFLRRTFEQEFFRRSLRLAAWLGLAGLAGVILVGHFMGQHIARYQPMKLAAAEAIWATRTNGMESMFADIDEDGRTNRVDMGVPSLLNFLVFDKPTGSIQGMEDIQEDFVKKYGPGRYIPPVKITYWSFRLMVMSGMAMLGLVVLLLIATARPGAVLPHIFYRVLLPAAALPHVANIAGWTVTEVGRQPWVVYGLLRVKDGLTLRLDGPTALASLILFTLIYTLLSFIALSLVIRFVKKGPDAAAASGH